MRNAQFEIWESQKCKVRKGKCDVGSAKCEKAKVNAKSGMRVVNQCEKARCGNAQFEIQIKCDFQVEMRQARMCVTHTRVKNHIFL